MAVHEGQFVQLPAVFQNGRIELAEIAIGKCQIASQSAFAKAVGECVDAENQNALIDVEPVIAFKTDARDLISHQEIVWHITEFVLCDTIYS